jgi:hypothetical protein
VIELPEAMVFAEQLNAEVCGKQIQSGTFGSAPHKWAFSNRPAEEYAAILAGKTIGGGGAARPTGGSDGGAVRPHRRLAAGGGSHVCTGDGRDRARAERCERGRPRRREVIVSRPRTAGAWRRSMNARRR